MRSLLTLVLLASCYQPTVESGLPCSENGSCPPGQTCERGLCLEMPGLDDAGDPDATPSDAAPSDAVDVATDAPLVDAPPSVLAWTETTPLPSPRSLLCLAAFGNRLYSIGGSFQMVAKVDVVTAPILANGTVGTWTSGPDLPLPTRWHGCAVDTTNPSLYVVGSDTGTAARDTVYRATIDPQTGTLGAWSVQPALPADRRGLGAVWVGGYVYAIGGEERDGFQLRDTVYRAATTPLGIGGWTTQTGLMPADYVFGTAVSGGRVYKTGGYNGDATVLVSPIEAGGALGAFASTSPLPGNRERHVTVADGSYVYVMGGESSLGGQNLGSAYRASINTTTGALGAWTALPTMPLAVTYASGVLVNGRIYVAGGSDGTSQTGRVFILSGL